MARRCEHRRVGQADRRVGLRSRIAISFALGALVVATLLAVTTSILTARYLIAKRESLALAQATANARQVASGLQAGNADVADVLGSLQGSPSTVSLVQRQGRWYSTSLSIGPSALPKALTDAVSRGEGGVQRIKGPDGVVLAIGLPVPRADAGYFEVGDLSELDRTLRTQRTILGAGSLGAVAVAAGAGLLVSRRVLAPLTTAASAAAAVAAGDLSTRVPLTGDPDLDRLGRSFNDMARALDERIARDTRFASDVSHELRSPLTSLSTAVQVLEGRREELGERSRRALDLVGAEVRRFQALVTDLLDISRADAGVDDSTLEPVVVADLVHHALTARPAPVPLRVDEEAREARALGDKRRLERVIANLVDNAEQHGHGVHEVAVHLDGGLVQIVVDDLGPGVPEADRPVIFGRFARGRAAGRRSGGSGGGVGLGLALVDEHVRLHGGRVTVADRPGGGARFVVELPLTREVR